MFQDGQISVGLHRKAQSMRQRAKALVQFHVSIIDRGAAINIRGRAKLLRNGFQWRLLTHHFFDARVPRPALHPSKMRRESSRIHVFSFA